MKLCAQLYSVRNGLQTPELIRETFGKIKEIGYKAVQFSGASTENAEHLRAVSREFDLPIVCTHVSLDRLLHETEKLIAEHKTFGCPVIGLGYIPPVYQVTEQGLKNLLSDLKEPVARILDAGLHFAYHNHNFEFEKMENGAIYYDCLLAECKDWQMILDTYWVEYAGYSAVDYIQKIGQGRLTNIHFKDMTKDEARAICACGDGRLDFSKIAAACAAVGTQNVLVEQDNAVTFPDPFAEMAKSYRHLAPILEATV